ncbi:MAG: bifunctional phosphoribosylaminoimidazolecarboxamide formyltransferase/IMP cyclohydrolase [Alphaproteobacteria bacterium]|nr:bifunctional phosphoribosylaminoimidazolecarboxamide formyltransferase/IMP cyclohydrolase [Alphaproteobacteria bacterium]
MRDPDARAIRRALISVSDKSGLVELAASLSDLGVELVSTGGSAAALRQAGLEVLDVSDITGFPEIMDGRVKTLHPRVHGGILARRGNDEDAAIMAEHGIAGIDLVAINLYPFEATVASGANFAACVENIDIGGPAMIRAAAKNHNDVTVVTDPADYPALIAELEATGGEVGADFRRLMAVRAFARTAAYDAAIAAWLAAEQDDALPATLVLAGRRRQILRYGENPHQDAGFYVAPDAYGRYRPGVATAEQVQGKELSYNNINDTDAAFELVAEFDAPAVAIIKHANPCGVAVADSLVDAYRRALTCDAVSAFGGIIAVNRSLDGAVAAEIAKLFAEVVIAPDADDAARAVLAGKANLRLLLTGAMPDPGAGGTTLRSVAGGWLAQGRDHISATVQNLKVVTKRAPSEAEIRDMLFAFTVAKHVKSNAIVYARDGATVGIGAGQTSRVDSARIAARKAEDAAAAAGLAAPLTKGSAVASDAFFPFADGLLAAAEAGATTVIQPGGSVRDDEVIAAADAAGLAMVLTGSRHFRH